MNGFFMIGKEHNYITSNAFLVSSKIKFNSDDYQSLGTKFAQAYEKEFGVAPEQVLTINSRRDDAKNHIKPCSLYPISFVPVMEEITIKYFAHIAE